ncbi:MAG: DnaD domain protein [Clostridia bacterium]|nr:DnaD domain protein [Clostridia bacterium]
MSIYFKYGKEVAVLPAAVISKIDRATKKDIKVLLALASLPGATANFDSVQSELARVCGCTETELAASVAFWRGAGMIETEDQVETAAESAPTEPAKVAETAPKKLERADALPNYTTEELANLLEQRREITQLIDECQNALGKIFNTHEINIVLGLNDYLELDGQYIVLLVEYCAKLGKKSLRYVEKKAFGLVDEGVTTVDTLIAYIDRTERMASLEGQIRSLFGMKDRELSTKEKKFFEKWVGKFGYGIEVIKKAYEITVDAIHEPSPAYTNAVLERWKNDGLDTLEQIEAAESQKLPGEGSFDTDDFFEAALRRSMENMKGEN